MNCIVNEEQDILIYMWLYGEYLDMTRLNTRPQDGRGTGIVAQLARDVMPYMNLCGMQIRLILSPLWLYYESV